MQPTLYLIPTTLGDIFIENVIPAFVSQIINTIDDYIVENEKSAKHYLKKLGIAKPLQEIKLYPLNQHTKIEEMQSYLNPLLSGKNMGMISEAGCPCIADPGAEIVRIAQQKKTKVVPLVGPSSIILALMASGLNGQNFAFNGYLPIEKSEKIKKIKSLESLSRQTNQTQIFIETPYRNEKFLQDILTSCNENTMLCIAADITLPSEFICTKTIREWKNNIPDLNKKPTIFLIQG